MNLLNSHRSATLLTRLVGALVVLLMTSALPASARDLPKSSAQRVGMSSERLSAIKDLSESYVADKKVPGMITMIARRGKIVQFEATGVRGAKDDRPLAKDDLFRIYSMTKPIVSVA